MKVGTRKAKASPPLTALLIASLLVPALLFALAAWQGRQTELRETAEEARTTAGMLHEHALKALQVYELIFDLVEARVKGLDWDTIRNSKELNSDLRSLVARFEQVSSIILVDPQGQLVVTTRRFPMPPGFDNSDRDYFKAPRDGHQGLFIDRPVVGRVSGQPIINISRRRSTAGGGFDGIIGIAVFDTYFTNFYQTIAPQLDHAIAMIREDGTVLLRDPVPPANATFPTPGASPFFAAARTTDEGIFRNKSIIDGIERIFAFKKVAGYPVYVLVGLGEEAALREWYANLAVYAVFAAAAFLALGSLAIAVLRRVRAEAATAQALEESVARYRALYNQTPTPLHSVDERGNLVSVSDCWLEFLGYEREEVIGRPITAFMDEDSAQHRTEALWSELHARDEVRDVPCRFVKRSGDLVEVLLSARVERGVTGNFVRTSTVLVDVTERNRAEERLRQAQRLEVVGQLTGGVAHDFNNLLTVVLINLELAERGVANEPMRSLLAGIRRAADRGARLTQQLLAFSRRQRLKTELVDANAVLAESDGLIRRALGEALELRLDLAGDLWPCNVDRPQFEAAILNLAVNARDAMPDGGTFSIETRNVISELGRVGDAPEPGEYVRVAVRDTGSGMPPDTLGRIFEPFFTTKEVGKGSGLGLSQVYGFVKQSGGHVAAESTVGRGTTITIWLPRATGVAAGREEAADRPAAATVRRAGNVLVVEDDPDVREVATTALVDLGYRALVAEDGPAALAILRGDASIDLLFTDVVMPNGMSGIELAAAARRLRPGIKILLTSGYADARSAMPSSELPAAMLAKPYRSADLAEKIRAVIAS